MSQIEPHTGRFDGARHLFAVRVYYEDTDLSGIVYHANYLRWFERARSDILQLLGIDQRAVQEAGEGFYAVASANMKFLAPARLGDAVTIETVAKELGAASVVLIQRAARADTVLAEAEIRIAFISPDGRPRRQPAIWQTAFSKMIVSEGIA